MAHQTKQDVLAYMDFLLEDADEDTVLSADEVSWLVLARW